MAKDGFAGTYGCHGRFAKGVILKNRIAFSIEADSDDNLLAILHQCSLLLFVFPICVEQSSTTHELVTISLTQSDNLKDFYFFTFAYFCGYQPK